ncbi:DUF72 domain-containing protein [Alkalimonas collagenimarina]|uniref:DUF72 domain-containing protein n=1 Tax=Alkalimonas collagenimarina TaxID=400390 RepID=A0ABT9GVR2_9GAMM|nr:DUF72 domain-containing protein [Alkalimonas collagenimarina]MDP4534805.1 DUF72 domain-containing protein [Alkalimonas collagenimarina]
MMIRCLEEPMGRELLATYYKAIISNVTAPPLCYHGLFSSPEFAMLYLGCPMWANANWKHSLFRADATAKQFLQQYAEVFNTVEGNTTFYADPKTDTIVRWAECTPANFRFVLKVPSRISHQVPADGPAALKQWWQLLKPLQHKIGHIHLQLPASTGPQHLADICRLLDVLVAEVPCCVEVRHPAFFDKAEHEVTLNRLLRDYGAERVVFDSRALFSVPATNDALADAQRKKPHLPVHAICLTDSPVVRFIGCDDLATNQRYYQPWLGKIRQWLDEGKTPYCYFHTPDNASAPELCRAFVKDLAIEHSVLALWPGEQTPKAKSIQPDLW